MGNHHENNAGVPAAATPSAEPTTRNDETVPTATPLCSRGIPVTAAVVITAFDRPSPIPKNANPVSSCPTFVPGDIPNNSTEPATKAPPDNINERPARPLPASRAAIGEAIIITIDAGMRKSPAASGENPRVPCR